MTRVPAWPAGGSNNWQPPLSSIGTTPWPLSVAISSFAAVRSRALALTVRQYYFRNWSWTMLGTPLE